jgi:hypothetical protein
MTMTPAMITTTVTGTTTDITPMAQGLVRRRPRPRLRGSMGTTLGRRRHPRRLMRMAMVIMGTSTTTTIRTGGTGTMGTRTRRRSTSRTRRRT